MGVDSINKTSKEISRKRIDEGKEGQAYQETEKQILGINSERQNNLTRAATENKMLEENNSNLEQAAGIMASEMASNNSEAPVVVQARSMNPQTQGILGKYGIGKPGTTRKTSSSTTQTPQKVTINNNTSTVNNVKVSQPPIPMAPPVIPMKPVQKQNNSSNNLKSWLSNVFARQKEQAVIRDKEYSKREWSLTRSANKMMRRMADIGKSFMERMDPRRITSGLFSQAKTLMFLLGFQYLSKNWGKILNFAGKVEEKVTEFVDFLKGNKDKDNFFVRLNKQLVKFLGGKENEGLGAALKGLFHEGIDYLKLKWDNAMELRAEAMKQIKFPDINLSDMIGTVKNVGVYLGNLLTALVNPQKGVKQDLEFNIKKVGVNDSLQTNNSGYSMFSESRGTLDSNGNKLKDTSWGDAVISTGRRKYNNMDVFDYSDDGTLANNEISSIKQGRTISAMINSTNSTVNTSGVMLGLSNLEKSANKSGYTLVDTDTLQSLTNLGVDVRSLPIGNNIGKYKYVQVEKTEEDKLREADPTSAFINSGINQFIRDKTGINKLTVASATTIGGIAGSVLPGVGTAAGAATGWAVSEIGTNKYVRGAISWVNSKIKRAASDDNTLKLVPVDDPRPAVQIPVIDKNTGKTKLETTFDFIKLTPNTINSIKSQIAKKAGKESINFDITNKESITTIDDLLRQAKKKNIDKELNSLGHTPVDLDRKRMLENSRKSIQSDLDYDKTFATLDRMNEMEREGDKKEQEAWDNSRAKRGIEYTKTAAKDAITGAVNLFNLRYNTSIPLPSWEAKRRSKIAMDRLINEFDLTPQQASGLVGNWVAESSLDTTLKNDSGGGNGALGLAQWRGDRQDNFVKYYNSLHPDKPLNHPDEILSLPFEDQLDFAIQELKTTHKNAITQIKKSTNPSDAAKAGFGYYEFSVGPEGAMEDMMKHGDSLAAVQDTFKKRQGYANEVYKDFLESNGEVSFTESDQKNGTEGHKRTNFVEELTPEEIQQSNQIPFNISPYNISSDNKEPSEEPTSSSYPDYNSINVSPWNTNRINNIQPDFYRPVETSGKPTNMSTSDNSGSDILKEMKNVTDYLKDNNNCLYNLNNNITYLAQIAANSGNVTVNNQGGNAPTVQGTMTPSPNTWGNDQITKGVF